MINGLLHIGITVEDWDAMFAFYHTTLRLSFDSIIPHPRGGKKTCLYGSGGEVIELIQYESPTPRSQPARDRARTGLHHIGFVVDDIVSEYQRLESAGVQFEGELKTNTHGDRVIHFWDPEGNYLHLTEVQRDSGAA